MKLKVGDKFRHICSGLEFEMLEIDESRDWCRVLCTNDEGFSWEETWDDLHYVYSALEIGEYLMKR